MLSGLSFPLRAVPSTLSRRPQVNMMPLFMLWLAARPPTPTLCAQPHPTTLFLNAALSSPFLSLQVLYMSCCGLLWTAYLSYASVVPQGAQPVVAGKQLGLQTSPTLHLVHAAWQQERDVVSVQT